MGQGAAARVCMDHLTFDEWRTRYRKLVDEGLVLEPIKHRL
jgi:hypothetical protein